MGKNVCPLVQEVLVMDFFAPPFSQKGMGNLILVIDRLSKLVRIIPCKKTDSEDTARRFIESVCRYQGLPDRLVSDRDSTWTSAFWAPRTMTGFRLSRSSSLRTTRHHIPPRARARTCWRIGLTCEDSTACKRIPRHSQKGSCWTEKGSRRAGQRIQLQSHGSQDRDRGPRPSPPRGTPDRQYRSCAQVCRTVPWPLHGTRGGRSRQLSIGIIAQPLTSPSSFIG